MALTIGLLVFDAAAALAVVLLTLGCVRGARAEQRR